MELGWSGEFVAVVGLAVLAMNEYRHLIGEFFKSLQGIKLVARSFAVCAGLAIPLAGAGYVLGAYGQKPFFILIVPVMCIALVFFDHLDGLDSRRKRFGSRPGTTPE
jgi:hypothetical protein